jgi:flagellar FliL protein
MKKIIIIVAVVLVVAGAAVYFFFLKPPPEPETIYYSPGSHFITNVKDSTRLLKATIVIEISTTDAAGVTEYLTENNHIVRDIILFTLCEKTEEELRATGVQEMLRDTIVSKLNSDMGIDYVQTIYFNDYVIQ